MFRRPFPCRVVIDGQSLANTPPWSGMSGGQPFILGYSWFRMAMLGMRLPGYDQPAVGGTSLTVLNTTFTERCAPYIAKASFEPTVYVLCGGHTDYAGEHDTGAQVYADAGALADKARSYGALYVICTTTFPSIAIAGADETQRQAGNALILADASNKFDAQIDFEVDGLDDPLDTASYFDGVHIYGGPPSDGFRADKGTAKAATVARPYIAAAVAAVT
jgi:hypothetical protein